MKQTEWTFAKTSIIAALIALAAISTLVIRIPIPATTGYFNIGDVFVILAGLWLGPIAGLLVGAIGPTLADAIGFPLYIPATMITKGLEGFLVGYIASKAKNDELTLRVVAVTVGAITIVVGYFTFQAFIYPFIGNYIPIFAFTDIGAAVVEIIPNAIQGVIGAIGGITLWKAISSK